MTFREFGKKHLLTDSFIRDFNTSTAPEPVHGVIMCGSEESRGRVIRRGRVILAFSDAVLEGHKWTWPDGSTLSVELSSGGMEANQVWVDELLEKENIMTTKTIIGPKRIDALINDFQDHFDQEGGGHTRGMIVEHTNDRKVMSWRNIAMRNPIFSAGAHYRTAERSFAWPNGGKLRVGTMGHYEDLTRFVGHTYTWIGVLDIERWDDPYAFIEFLLPLLRAPDGIETSFRCTVDTRHRGAGATPGWKWANEHLLGNEQKVPRTRSIELHCPSFVLPPAPE